MVQIALPPLCKRQQFRVSPSTLCPRVLLRRLLQLPISPRQIDSQSGRQQNASSRDRHVRYVGLPVPRTLPPWVEVADVDRWKVRSGINLYVGHGTLGAWAR
jgi:hypothetical protein